MVKTKTSGPLIPGVVMQIAGREFTVPPLTLGQLRQLMPKVKMLIKVDAEMNEEQIGILIEIVTAAVQRNYPDVDAAAMENLLDLGNANAVLLGVLGQAGLKPGEAAAAMSTGQKYTAPSSPPDTPSAK